MNTLVPKNDITLSLGSLSLAANGKYATLVGASAVVLLAILLLKSR